ncbi:hypothetical protein PUN28_016487 [Cardiocondyla obscurior]|uniref:Uncharacterized protein n=1 Tax=Cardiocondyla obscurior TaxID=286306 RepID=A0AAW2EMC2_9HYME
MRDVTKDVSRFEFYLEKKVADLNLSPCARTYISLPTSNAVIDISLTVDDENNVRIQFKQYGLKKKKKIILYVNILHHWITQFVTIVVSSETLNNVIHGGKKNSDALPGLLLSKSSFVPRFEVREQDAKTCIRDPRCLRFHAESRLRRHLTPSLHRYHSSSLSPASPLDLFFSSKIRDAGNSWKEYASTYTRVLLFNEIRLFSDATPRITSDRKYYRKDLSIRSIAGIYVWLNNVSPREIISRSETTDGIAARDRAVTNDSVFRHSGRYSGSDEKELWYYRYVSPLGSREWTGSVRMPVFTPSPWGFPWT